MCKCLEILFVKSFELIKAKVHVIGNPIWVKFIYVYLNYLLLFTGLELKH